MSWDELTPILLELAERRPTPLISAPDPRIGGVRRPPFRIRLAAWAESVAAGLAARFGDEVRLIVGCLTYPEGTRVDGAGRPVPDPGPDTSALVDAGSLEVDLREELAVASGHQGRATLVLTNHTRAPIGLRFPSARETAVVDPEDGRVVGGPIPAGRPRTRRAVELGPRRSGTVRVRVGTASYDVATGWAVPAGTWALRVYLEQADGSERRAALLPLTIV